MAARTRVKVRQNGQLRPSATRTVPYEQAENVLAPARQPIASVAGGQISRLGNAQLHRAQRHALVTRIGHLQGNRYLQRVVSSLKGVDRDDGAGVAQRQPVKGEIAPTGKASTGSGVTRIFGIKDPLWPTGFVDHMIAYFQKTLGEQAAFVDSVQKLLDRLVALGRKGVRVRRLIIVAHGAPSGAVKGGTILKPLVKPQDLLADPKAGQVRKKAMAKGAVVEFWACNIGKASKALKGWAKVFGAEARATPGKMGVERRIFTRPALTYGEYKAKLKRSRTHKAEIIVENVNEIYNMALPKSPLPPWNKGFASQKAKWVSKLNRQLVKWYDRLVKSREILETKPARKPAQKLTYMGKLFDRSGGIIRYVYIKKSGRKVRPIRKPGHKLRAWLRMWKKASFSP